MYGVIKLIKQYYNGYNLSGKLIDDNFTIVVLYNIYNSYRHGSLSKVYCYFANRKIFRFLL